MHVELAAGIRRQLLSCAGVVYPVQPLLQQLRTLQIRLTLELRA